jgi:hypothetical protein
VPGFIASSIHIESATGVTDDDTPDCVPLDQVCGFAISGQPLRYEEPQVEVVGMNTAPLGALILMSSLSSRVTELLARSVAVRVMFVLMRANTSRMTVATEVISKLRTSFKPCTVSVAVAEEISSYLNRLGLMARSQLVLLSFA